MRLDRLEVDDRSRVEDKVAEIHRQLGVLGGAVPGPVPVPICEIAAALDIVEINEVPSTGFEAALITDAERDLGLILVNRSSPRRRRRFSVAHELAHFLCDWHVFDTGNGFACSRQDMSEPRGGDRHRAQEAEANRFAIQLLAPEDRFSSYCRRHPDLDHVTRLAASLDISRTAAARRYVSLHARKVAVLFSSSGLLQYVEKSPGFPFIALSRGQPLPPLPRQLASEGCSDMVEANPMQWGLPRGLDLGLQAIHQDGGHAIVLLVIDDQPR